MNPLKVGNYTQAPPILFLSWWDAQTVDGWTEPDHFNHRAMLVFSVGWLVKETETEITITSCRSSAGELRYALTIPKCCITSHKILPPIAKPPEQEPPPLAQTDSPPAPEPEVVS
jgi:hypothetical protein